MIKPVDDIHVVVRRSPMKGIVIYRIEPVPPHYDFAIHVVHNVLMQRPMIDVLRAPRHTTAERAAVFARAMIRAEELATAPIVRDAALDAQPAGENPNPWREQIARSEE